MSRMGVRPRAVVRARGSERGKNGNARRGPAPSTRFARRASSTAPGADRAAKARSQTMASPPVNGSAGHGRAAHHHDGRRRARAVFFSSHGQRGRAHSGHAVFFCCAKDSPPSRHVRPSPRPARPVGPPTPVATWTPPFSCGDEGKGREGRGRTQGMPLRRRAARRAVAGRVGLSCTDAPGWGRPRWREDAFHAMGRRGLECFVVCKGPPPRAKKRSEEGQRRWLQAFPAGEGLRAAPSHNTLAFHFRSALHKKKKHEHFVLSAVTNKLAAPPASASWAGNPQTQARVKAEPRHLWA
jgi:hypothetical protein